MSLKEAKKRNAEWRAYNPYFWKGDLVFVCFLISIILFSGIFGLFYYPKVFLVICGVLALAQALVVLVDIMTAEIIGNRRSEE